MGRTSSKLRIEQSRNACIILMGKPEGKRPLGRPRRRWEDNIKMDLGQVTACLVQWLARLTAIQEVPGSIPGYTLEIFVEVQGLERGPPSLVRTIGQLLDMRGSEIRSRKLKLRLRDKRFANRKAPCTVIRQQPLQSVLALWSCSATEFEGGGLRC